MFLKVSYSGLEIVGQHGVGSWGVGTVVIVIVEVASCMKPFRNSYNNNSNYMKKPISLLK